MWCLQSGKRSREPNSIPGFLASVSWEWERVTGQGVGPHGPGDRAVGPQHCAIAALCWLKLQRERWARSRSWDYEGDSLGTEEGGGTPWALFPPTLLYASTSSCHWPKLPRKPEEKENEADPRRGRWGKGSEQRGYPPLIPDCRPLLVITITQKKRCRVKEAKVNKQKREPLPPKSVGLWSIHHAVSLTVLGSTWKLLLLQFWSRRVVTPPVCRWPTSCHWGLDQTVSFICLFLVISQTKKQTYNFTNFFLLKPLSRLCPAFYPQFLSFHLTHFL